MKPFGVLLAVLMLLLSGCAGLIKELKSDPTIVGATGFWASIGFDPNPGALYLPLPHLKIGYGTLWRIGAHDKVEITTGSTAGTVITSPGASAVPGGTPGAPPGSETKGAGSLTIKAEGVEGLKALLTGAAPPAAPMPPR